MNFCYKIGDRMKQIVDLMFKKAKEKHAIIVVCEGWDPRTVEAAHNLVKKKICKLVLLGNPDEITKICSEHTWSLGDTKIIDHKKPDSTTEKMKKEFAQKLYELRKSKGMTMEEAAKLVDDENYFGCMYAYSGYADGVAGSTICSTGALMSPVMRILRTKDALVSETAMIYFKKVNRVIFMTDVSLNPNPTAEDLAVMGVNAAEVAKLFDFEPKTAFMSFSTYGSGGADKPEVKIMKDAMLLARKKAPQFVFDGEMQGDAAVNPKSAARKCPDSPIKGEANVLVFPNLTTANLVCHLLGQLSECDMVGTVLKGLEKPVSILGRSATPKMIEEHIACCAMQVK